MGIRRVRERPSTKAVEVPGSCLVRSGTDYPCHRPAEVKIGGVPFCRPCAREQEAYFALGELMEEPRSAHDVERLVRLLGRVRGANRATRLRTDEPDAA